MSSTATVLTSTQSSEHEVHTSRKDDMNDKVFDLDEDFWNNYMKGRPQPPKSFFDRIFDHHAAQGRSFGTLHDVGAGNSPYAKQLRARFSHVIISDIAAQNVDWARARLGGDGFTYRVAKVEEADDIAAGSVDMVFATNMMHFVDQNLAMTVIAKQLKPGGTFACAGYGACRFEDPQLEDLWARINHQGGRALIDKSDEPERTIAIMGRTQDRYNVAPLDPDQFRPGAKRIRLNLDKGGVAEMVPPEQAHRITESCHIGAHDVEIFESDEGWYFEADLAGVKEHMNSFPYLKDDSSAMKELVQELEVLLKDGRRVRGYWPANIILATRR